MTNKSNAFEEIWNNLLESKRILIPLHPKPDGDSLGSCVAMKHVLERGGKKVTVISKDELSENLTSFKFSKEVVFGKGIEDLDMGEFDILLLLDHFDFKKYYPDLELEDFSKHVLVINIDHHETNESFAEINYVDKKSPSCASIIFDMLGSLKADFNEKICRALLLGICTDTNFGEYGNSADSFEKMAFLVKTGKINFQKDFFIPILKSNTWKLKKLHGILLQNMNKVKIGSENVVSSFVTEKEAREFDLNLADLRHGIICMQDIKEINLVFTLTELEDKIKDSFRSVNIDTIRFAEEMGGGGHRSAAGFYLERMPMEEAIEKVLCIIKKRGIKRFK